jgi:peptidyl-prolyl cis-trans isomerase B (cyclophilin B)
MNEKPDRRLIILALFALIAAGIVAAILISRSGGDDETTSANGCERVETPEPKQVSFKAPQQTVEKGEELTAVVATSCGEFEIALDSERAPKTVNSFVFLSEEGVYDGLAFHRIAPEFVIQGGDPEGTSAGGPGYSIEEKPPSNLAYTKGVVAMAKAANEPAGTSASQFFVITAPGDSGLPPEYALVGKVSEGFETVARIDALGTPEEKPKQPVVIESITIERG